MPRPRIGITIGDPGGIGPEVTLKTLEEGVLPEADFILFGSPDFIEEEIHNLNSSAGISKKISLHPIEHPMENFIKGEPSAASGRASFHYFQTAVKEAQKKHLDALVTAPISKKFWKLAGSGDKNPFG